MTEDNYQIKYITLENLGHFLEKFKEMMAGEKNSDNKEGDDPQKEIDKNG